MSKRYRLKRRARYNENRKCQDCGKRGTIACFLFDGGSRMIYSFRHANHDSRPAMRERDPDERLCRDCAAKAGFCRCCGEFWGGIDSFEFTHPGICDHCADDIRQDMEDESDNCCEEADVPW